jgi:hypothetical protein
VTLLISLTAAQVSSKSSVPKCYLAADGLKSAEVLGAVLGSLYIDGAVSRDRAMRGPSWVQTVLDRTLRDQTGAAVANATAAIRSGATQLSREPRKDKVGACVVFALPPSIYEIKILAPRDSPTNSSISLCANTILEFWQLACIPSAANSLDEKYACIHSPPLDIDVIALIGKKHRLCGDHLKIVIHAALIPVCKQL